MNTSRQIGSKVLYFLLTLLALLVIYAPIAWLFLASISTRADLLATPPRWIPEHPTLKNYLDILVPGTAVSEVARTFKITLGNSLLVALTTTVISLVIGSLAAYALARLRLPFRNAVFFGVLSVRMIPEISLVIPLYIIAARLSILNKPIVLILTYLSFALPFTIWMLTTFFETVPEELEDAALIDGSSRLNTLFRVVIPVAAPGIISTALFTFLLAWDEFFFALIFTSTVAAKTVPVAIAEFTGRYAVDITAMMTGGILAALPPVLLALIFQRFIVSGLSAGAVKG
ncbi:carbohydrate ABC transporter membrane protein 2, CUT1 family [Bellilinea caldifistulae]|jgi:multiple sugar transport system permease protein|uniref:ABC transporter permease n=1 Tax=Bellilinea caldifistulae TaxID=360411 RepID=A0A0P6XPL6_9CHLR|nr:carbohydrate ABC transporter permease [Bellilinea caldifistulae]KPL78607.1 ABC transporter permease [Bellilinea caldifistulae]GAP09442.1 carbohydrate ABC transporter membrane protein 2, CUT1 family [Bellilinea caldifistulae]